MKNKNTVVTLLVIFTAICFYNLYWSYVQFDSEQQLEKGRVVKAMEGPLSQADSATLKTYEALLTDEDFQAKYKKSIDRSFTLGLDLQGGMFVTLEIGVKDLVKKLAGNPNDPLFNEAIECAAERQTTEAVGFVDLFVECFKEKNPNGSLGATFANPELEISVRTTDAEVQEKLNKEAEDAIDLAFNVIRTRIDQFGVVSPNLQKQESTGRILLELPGVKEPERVRKLVRSTAKLEFYATHPWSDAYPVLIEINEKLRQEGGLVDSTDTEEGATEATTDSDQAVAADSTAGDSTSDDSTSTFSTTDADTGEVAFDQLSPEEQEKRREEFRRENPLFALLNPADFNTFSQVGSATPMVGAAHWQDTAEVNKILKRDEIQVLIPDDMRFVWGFKPISEESEFFQMIAIRVNDEGEPDLDGEAVSVARQDFDPSSGKAVVSMRMTPDGAKAWGRITEANIGKHVAILLDNYVYSYPVVNEAIRGGSSQISGDFEIDEAKDLANVLKAGQLPVPAEIEGEETVGPTLGQENINSGMFSFLGSFLITLIFMAVYYNKSGWVANLALIANLVFILGCSAAFTIVLTLPGIAAVVLTVGMAVDANVLIFERIREELGREKTLKASIKAGFSNAFSSVMDANITTFLTGVVLYAFGVGPIRGFAVSLMIGIITSLISALVITRLILDYYGNKGGSTLNFGTKWSLNVLKGITINMVARKKTFYIASLAVVLASFAAFATIGFKTGVDFKGGRQFVVEFTQQDGTPASLSGDDIETIRKDLNDAFENSEPVIKTLSTNNQIMITTSYLVGDREATQKVEEIMKEGLQKNFSQYKNTTLSTSDVGPTVANDIRQAAYFSVIFSLLIIFFYILVRFRKWQYSLGALAAVFHDVTIVLGVFSVLSIIDLPFNVEISQTFIAALLTIIGYSINDTVVVFDRIRENIGEMKSSKLNDIYNISIDQTISRTLITSLTTFMTVLILFIWGGDTIKGFTFAMMIGIIVGTYSSIFVASPISLDLINREKAKQEEAAKA
jgi:SecD/SecF fusion protein